HNRKYSENDYTEIVIRPIQEALMRHRLFYLLPDINSAMQARNDLLINCIEKRHIHFMANCILPPELPEANLFHKTDIVHGAEIGMLVGAGLGIVFGLWLVNFPFDYVSFKPALILFATAFGIAFGGWAASMAAAAVPNSRLAAFYPEIERGKILLIVDVPSRRVTEIEEMLAKHAEIQFKGEDSHIPTFP
ncbi:MAG: hypothetical protein JWQ21_1124, partial [Herminiimonas sp.]|nr:hypothetical protein [Herminiimonas sp.]